MSKVVFEIKVKVPAEFQDDETPEYKAEVGAMLAGILQRALCPAIPGSGPTLSVHGYYLWDKEITAELQDMDVDAQ